MSKNLLIISLAVCFFAGAALVFFTHKYWCSCHSESAPVLSAPFGTHTDIIPGKSLDSADRVILSGTRERIKQALDKTDSINQTPVTLVTIPCPDRSYKIDTLIPWKDTANKDSGFYHISHYSDCLFRRDVDLFVESTPRHAPASAEHGHSLVSTAVVEALGKADKWFRVAAFLEHDFFKGGYTGGFRLHIDLGGFHLYGAACIGAENLPVGLEYDLWKP